MCYVTVDIVCPAPLPGTNTKAIPDEIMNGLINFQTYAYSCMEGYYTTDELCTICQPDGNLSLAVPPICTG